MKVGLPGQITVSSYGAINHFQKQLGLGIENAGGTSVFCNTEEDTIGLDAFILVNAMPVESQSQIASYVDQYWVFLLDAPFHHVDTMVSGPPSAIFAVVDPSHLEILSLVKRRGVFMPHGGDIHSPRSWGNRHIDVLLTGTAPGLDKWTSQIESLSPDLRDLTYQLIQEELSAASPSLFKHLVILMQQAGRNMTLAEAIVILTLADHVIRATHRMNVLQAFSDFSVVIAGKGWDQVPMSPHHRWMGEVPMPEISELMNQAKIVLCPSCGFNQGAHERILTAMGSGAVPLTMQTPYLTEHFQHATHLAYFNQLPEAVESAREILQGTQWESVGEAGHHAVASGHTWAHRGKEFVKLLRSVEQSSKILQSIPVVVDA